MFRPKRLIHLLVSLALTLNGVGAAAAAEATAPVSAAVESGCHEHRASTAQADADAVDTDLATEKGDPSNCCNGGGCGFGCAHQSQVLLAAESLMMPAIAPASIAWEQRAAALSPSLSKPVRPPIA